MELYGTFFDGRKVKTLKNKLEKEGYKVEVRKRKAVFVRGFAYTVYTDRYIHMPTVGKWP